MQFFGGEAEGVGEFADGFESAQGVEASRGKKGEGADEIRSAEEIGDVGSDADAGSQLGRRPGAHWREVKVVIAEPLGGVFACVQAVFRRILQRGEGAGRGELPSGKEGAELGRRNRGGERCRGNRGGEQEGGAFHDGGIFCLSRTRR